MASLMQGITKAAVMQNREGEGGLLGRRWDRPMLAAMAKLGRSADLENRQDAVPLSLHRSCST